MPGRAKITKEIDQVLLDMKGTMQEIFSYAHKISLCADLWTKMGMTSSYLGITGHFLCRRGYKKHIVMLAIHVLAQPHTAEHIKFTLDEVLNEWRQRLWLSLLIMEAIWSKHFDKQQWLVMIGKKKMHMKRRKIQAIRRKTQAIRRKTQAEEDTSDKEEDTSEEEDAIEEEVLGEDFDFVQKKLDHEMTFRCYCKHLSCFSHTLQLVMLKFSKQYILLSHS